MTPSALFAPLNIALKTLDDDGLRRQRRTLNSPCGPVANVDGQDVISFCSNDYLGLANDPALREAAQEGICRWGVGSGAAHLVSGHFAAHEALEKALAAFGGFDRALYFSNGYMANIGMVTALAGRDDEVFADKLNHASLIDAVQLSRAKSTRYPHNDMARLATLLQESRAKTKLIVSDAVFSMDGDLAPLPALYALAERYDAWLLIDDAHGFGVLGDAGRGALSHFNLPHLPRVLYMATLGKAAGVSGAFVAGDATVIEWILQRARTYIFTTGSSPVLAHTLLKSLTLIAEADERRAHLQRLRGRLQAALHGCAYGKLLPSISAIQPFVLGDNHLTLRCASALRARGLWVPAIRPPTVPKGSARLRISLSAAHQEAHLSALISALQDYAA